MPFDTTTMTAAAYLACPLKQQYVIRVVVVASTHIWHILPTNENGWILLILLAAIVKTDVLRKWEMSSKQLRTDVLADWACQVVCVFGWSSQSFSLQGNSQENWAPNWAPTKKLTPAQKMSIRSWRRMASSFSTAAADAVKHWANIQYNINIYLTSFQVFSTPLLTQKQHFKTWRVCVH